MSTNTLSRSALTLLRSAAALGVATLAIACGGAPVDAPTTSTGAAVSSDEGPYVMPAITCDTPRGTFIALASPSAKTASLHLSNAERFADGSSADVVLACKNKLVRTGAGEVEWNCAQDDAASARVHPSGALAAHVEWRVQYDGVRYYYVMITRPLAEGGAEVILDTTDCHVTR